MDKKVFRLIEEYMKECMSDSSHDTEHVYRVLYIALIIADTEENVDYDVLITACLLHDGRIYGSFRRGSSGGANQKELPD